MAEQPNEQAFVDWFRSSSPYIHAHRGRTVVVTFGGEAVAAPEFAHLIHDLALLHSLGIHLVVVHGARPQIESRLRERGVSPRFVDGLRITDDAALQSVKDGAGAARLEVEALLSMGLANSPMAGARLRVACGNFVIARPLGVRDGVDYCYTGEVRRIDADGIRGALNEGAICLLSPLGYSPTGEVFNLSAEQVATTVATRLRADKLLVLMDRPLLDAAGRLLREASPAEAEARLTEDTALDETAARSLRGAIHAARHGVRRVHLLDRRTDGALLLELFTRDGVGTMVTAASYEGLRQATPDDVGGIIELITPLEADGTLVRRSREHLESDIGDFTVIERDGMVVACAALHHVGEGTAAELGCLAVHPAYRDSDRGDELLRAVERRAERLGVDTLFVLTTQAIHWFRERGFEPASLEALPVARRALYNRQRNSKLLLKSLIESSGRQNTG